MLSLLSLKGLVSGLLFAGLATAAPTSPDLESRASTCNTASNRACWQTGYTISTDYEASTPPGGSVSVSWEITEQHNWTGPDGVVKPYVQLVNGQYPGPTLRANWGDTISVTVKNSLPNNG
jgi:FtsP/CotA-like multicopper oxidase with cupredoxin domain